MKTCPIHVSLYSALMKIFKSMKHHGEKWQVQSSKMNSKHLDSKGQYALEILESGRISIYQASAYDI